MLLQMKMLNRLLCQILACLSFFACVIAHGSAQSETPINFVIIFLDDAGYADFSPMGNPEYPTPNVDRLANEGTVFQRFYVPQAVCSASRAAAYAACQADDIG